jgi:hypothetical protein
VRISDGVERAEKITMKYKGHGKNINPGEQYDVLHNFSRFVVLH